MVDKLDKWHCLHINTPLVSFVLYLYLFYTEDLKALQNVLFLTYCTIKKLQSLLKKTLHYRK